MTRPILSNPELAVRCRRFAIDVVKRFRASVAGEERCTLGEGPVWDGDRNRVLWVDISAGAVHTGTLDGERVAEDSVLELPETVGAVACARDGELLVAGARRLYRVSPEGAVSPGPQLIADNKASRLNDGACDPAGRFLVGSLALDKRAHDEVLVRIDAEGRIDTIDDDLGMSNGLAFTPAGDVLYSIDTVSRIVWSREYDSRTGSVGRRREFLRLDGSPDGMCADEEGNLWIAIWGAGQVRCYSPAGNNVPWSTSRHRTPPASHSSARPWKRCSSPPPRSNSPPRSTLVIPTQAGCSSPTLSCVGCPFRRGQAHTRGRILWSKR